MANNLMFIGSWNSEDYFIILMGISALFLAFSLIFRLCCAHKKAIDLTLIPVICVAIMLVIKIFHFEASLIYVARMILLLLLFAISIHILIDNAAASLSVYDKPKHRLINLCWCLGFYAVISSLFLL